MSAPSVERPDDPAVNDGSSTGPSLRPGDAKWGDKFRAAYDQSKRHFPDGLVSYRAISERVSTIIPVSSTSILRLGYLDKLPDTPSTRQLIYLSLMAMGYDPLEFGLEPRDRALKGLTTDIELRQVLDPGKIIEKQQQVDGHGTD